MKSAKRKGTNKERLLARLFDGLRNVRAHRNPGSGAFMGLPHDVSIRLEHRDGFTDFTAEVKARRDGRGFVQLERWKGQADLLVLWRDRQEPLICMDFPTFAMWHGLVYGSE